MKKPKIFYGYWVLLSCFIFMALGAGATFLSFSFFITSLQADMGWSRTEIMTAFTINMLCMGASAPFVGKLIDRYGARRVLTLGAVVTVGGFAILSQMSSLPHYYLGYCVIGIGSSAISHVPASYVVGHWFARRRGMAMGVMSMGVGIAGFFFAPLVAVYLIPTFGWRHAYLALGAIIACIIIPLVVFVIRTRPADKGLLPDGIEAHETDKIAEASAAAAGGLSLKAATGTVAFWLLVGYIMLTHTHVGVQQSVVPHLEDNGFGVGITASAMSIISITGTVSMFFFGWLSDRIPAKFAGAIGLALIILATLLFINIREGSPAWMVWLFAVLFGFGNGHWMPVMAMLVSNNFGMVAYGTIFGVCNVFQNLGSSLSPVLAGYLYDTTQTYRLAFAIIIGLMLVAIPLVLAVRRPALTHTERTFC